ENIKEFLPTNFADNNRGLTNIINNLQFHLKNLPHVGTTLPKTWIDIRRILEETLEKEQKNYITLEEYLKICQTNKVKNNKDALQISQFLHDIGVILHFQEDKASPLYKTVILNPEWGTDAVYKVLDHHQVIQNLGKFTTTDLADIWSNPEYKNMLPELLELMKKFKLCYQLTNAENTYIAPQLLTKEPPQYELFNQTENLLMKYEYEFLPKGIIIRFIVEMSRLIDEANVWQTGVLLKRKENNQITFVEVIESYNRREINIKFYGDNKKGLLEIITNKFDEIHESYHQLQVKQLISCNCQICSNKQTKNPHYYKLDLLKKRYFSGKLKIECEKEPFEEVNIISLIDDTIGWKKVKQKTIKLEDNEIVKLKEETRHITNYNFPNATLNNTAFQSPNSNQISQTHSGNGDNIGKNKNINNIPEKQEDQIAKKNTSAVKTNTLVVIWGNLLTTITNWQTIVGIITALILGIIGFVSNNSNPSPDPIPKTTPSENSKPKL
ncbi:MAG TPA: hypothetical protein DCF68_16425, partial [Cyanothece sp. UBA12306]|nr:hypothetical protein [Cyanothece sp. UBA12306]